MAATTGGHSMNLMACVRESSPPQDSGVETDAAMRHETKRKRFHPFRGLRRMFRRKSRHSGCVTPAPSDPPVSVTPVDLDTHRSRSTSELLAGDEPTRRRSGAGFYTSGHSGLSVSHDSVFSAEQHSHPSNPSSSEDLGQSSSSLSIQQLVLPGVQAELFDAVRRRRGGAGGGRGRGDTSDDEEDLGLPRSPCISPTTVDVLMEKGHKEHPTKSHSTCSDGSLLSMGSSEMDEDSLGDHSGHSSKLSLHDKKLFFDNDIELDLGVSATPLSHSAARHKMSVRPKRTHGAPRRRRTQQLSVVSELPTTPEVNEDILGRSSSPDPRTMQNYNPDLNASAELLDWQTADNPITATTTQLKSASLPPGLALSSELPALLPRSRSNASKANEAGVPQYRRNLSTSALEIKEPKQPNQIGAEVLRSRELFSAVGEEEEEEDRSDDKKKEDTFFGRFLPRRSGKKKKDKVDEEEMKVKVPEMLVAPKRIDEKGRYANERMYESQGMRNKVPLRPRQRVEAINLPPSPDTMRNDSELNTYLQQSYVLGTSPSKIDSSINRMQISYSASPPKPTWPEGSVYSKSSVTDTKIVDYVTKSQPEEPVVIRPSLRVGGLTSYQQKAQIGSDNIDERDYTSLIHAPNEDPNLKYTKLIKKSKSFRDSLETSLLTKGTHDEFGKDSRTVVSPHFQNKDAYAKVDNSRIISNYESSEGTNGNFVEPEKSHDHKGIFTKNINITARSVLRETKHKHDGVIKKSLSLESVSSIDNSSAPLRPTNKSSSSESISSLTQQMTTTAADSGGITITQTVTKMQGERTSGDGCDTTEPQQHMPAAPVMVHISSKPVEKCNENLLHCTSALQLSGGPSESQQAQVAMRDTVRNSKEIPKVPEFLRVQLNRVDSKPAINIVLSTSAIFDTDKVESPPVEELPKVEMIEKVNGIKEVVANVGKVCNEEPAEDVPQVSLLGLRIKRDGRDDLSYVESPKVEKTEKLENFTFRTQELIQKPFDVKVEPIPKPRSISLIPTSPTRKFPPLSPPVTPSRQLLKKQSSQDLIESQNELRRQFTNEFDNIQIVEKEVTRSAVPAPRKKSVSSDDNADVKKPELSTDVFVPEFALRKKLSMRGDLVTRSEDSIVIIEKHSSGDESPEVVLRKKSRDFSQRRDEEPELLKVFARRSLKIKDSDSEAIVQLAVKREVQVPEPVVISRDSDKENEGDSPKEERKKQVPIKEPLVESKPRTDEASLKIASVPSTGFTPRLPFKYQRSVSIIGSSPVTENNGLSSKENNPASEKRHRKSVTEVPTISDKVAHRWTNIYKDKEIDLTNSELNKTIPTDVKHSVEEEENVPRFKRIQQRKEEWELRAQQAAKKTIP